MLKKFHNFNKMEARNQNKQLVLVIGKKFSKINCKNKELLAQMRPHLILEIKKIKTY